MLRLGGLDEGSAFRYRKSRDSSVIGLEEKLVEKQRLCIKITVIIEYAFLILFVSPISRFLICTDESTGAKSKLHIANKHPCIYASSLPY